MSLSSDDESDDRGGRNAIPLPKPADAQTHRMVARGNQAFNMSGNASSVQSMIQQQQTTTIRKQSSSTERPITAASWSSTTKVFPTGPARQKVPTLFGDSDDDDDLGTGRMNSHPSSAAAASHEEDDDRRILHEISEDGGGGGGSNNNEEEEED